MAIGLIGLGNMGVHFGTRLLAAGQSLHVFDANPAAMAALVTKGAKATASPGELASRAEVVLLSLPTPQVVEGVARELLAPGSTVRVVADLSTTGPTVARAVSETLARADVAFVGAPVSGGTIAAEQGTLAVMASGPQDHYHALLPVLETLGRNIFYLGADPGSGQIMKLINNTLSAVSAVASFEALVLGAKAGLDAQAMLDIINVSSGRSFATQEKIPQCILHRDFPMRFTTDLMYKDVKLCLEEAERMGATMIMGPAARQFFGFGISQGDGPKDYAHLIEHFETWAGARFGKPRAVDPAA